MQKTIRNARYLAVFAYVVIMALFLVACGTSGGGSSTSTTPSSTTHAPAITSANSAVFVEGTASTFEVTTSGTPVPSLTATGTGAIAFTFVDNGNGTGTISSKPTATGVELLSITASNSAGTPAVQNFTLTVAAPDDDILPITNGITIATVNSHWILLDGCSVTGVVLPINAGLQFELTSGDSGFKAVFTDTLGNNHTSIGTWAANGGNSLIVTTTSVSNPGKYATSWTVSSLNGVSGATNLSSFAAWVNWFYADNPEIQTSPGLIPPTTLGCNFALASGGL
jgi:hypothetical protein